MGFRSCSGGTPLARHPAEGHPQVLIIARYYFQERDPDLALAHQLPYTLRLRDMALASSEAVVRRSGRQLSLAVEQLSTELDDNFLHTHGGPGEVLAAYAADHGEDPSASAPAAS
jgi:hypothetical protein